MTIFEEILSLLSGSPELHAYLLARPEQLQTTDYAGIIAGAPVALKEKKRLLDRLSGHEAHSEDTGLIRDYSACLNTALQALESKEAVFSVELWKDGEQIDGPYIALSVEEVQRAIPKYWENGDTAIAYWRIDQYRPGDILEVGCAPYVSEPHYCILTEVGDDCCGVQCLYPGENGRIEFGALKHGHYFSGCFDRRQYISPLYGAKIYTGELSDEYKFMKPLSEKLHKDPAFGKVLWKIGYDLCFFNLGFFQPQ